MEIWKDVKGFEGRYKISNHGRLMSINSRYSEDHILDTCINRPNGYYATALKSAPKKRHVTIHTLVAENFLEKPDKKSICVNHKDGNKLNNHVSNLEWITRSENTKHAYITGLSNTKGNKNGRVKITETQAHAIKYKLIGFTQRELGKIFGVSHIQIGRIINGESWPHINKDFYNPNSCTSNSVGL